MHVNVVLVEGRGWPAGLLLLEVSMSWCMSMPSRRRLRLGCCSLGRLRRCLSMTDSKKTEA